ncbi:sulfotransferase [Leptobacterium sp. I13]|uniref:sulfotransferase family protein n=1 Tax=Leptobacterium meishanense TaxID=3128904 RepID=UPI0030EEFB49
MIKPNTFLIGVQKSATTSVYNWIAQHPEICAPVSLKYIPFFVEDSLYNKGAQFLHKTYKKYYKNQKIILQGNVNYIFFKKGIERIYEFDKNAKFILILRNPVERAISSYFFAKKRGIESRNITLAFDNEKDIFDGNNLHDICELTYKTHGLYAQQLKIFLRYFSIEQVCILLFDEIKEAPENQLKKIFNFLEVDDSFNPKLNYLNKAGVSRSKWIYKILYDKENNIKKFLNKYIADKFFSFDFKIRVKLFLGKILSKESKEAKNDVPEALIKKLNHFFEKDILELEKIIDKDLSTWKNK